MSVRPYRDIQRRKSRQIRVGSVLVGGDAPITVQSMTNTPTPDAKATIDQVRQLEDAGADIVRVSCPDEDSTTALSEIVRAVKVPIVADIHFHYKRAIEAAIALIACAGFAWVGTAPLSTELTFPFFKDLVVNLGWFFVPVAAFVIVGAGNAVNLTDGLDGLAIMPAALVIAALGVFAYASGNAVFANYLSIPAIPHAGELLIFCASLAGAGLGFLWFNSYPAQVFMGDVGSLSIGGFLGILAVLTKNELLLTVLGGVFVVEALSVITQVVSFKLTGKRVFKMAPIHHHFELKGLTETKIIVRFWIISILLAILSLSTLKLR